MKVSLCHHNRYLKPDAHILVNAHTQTCHYRHVYISMYITLKSMFWTKQCDAPVELGCVRIRLSYVTNRKSCATQHLALRSVTCHRTNNGFVFDLFLGRIIVLSAPYVAEKWDSVFTVTAYQVIIISSHRRVDLPHNSVSQVCLALMYAGASYSTDLRKRCITYLKQIV